MGPLLAVIVALLAMIVFGWLSSKAGKGKKQQSGRILLGVLSILGGVILSVRGLGIVGVYLIPIGIGLLSPLLGDSIPGMGRGRQSRSAPPRPPSGLMSAKEAAKVLGVTEAASRDEIEAAYKAMMKRVHPDAGGSDGLAARVQEARDVLIGKP